MLQLSVQSKTLIAAIFLVCLNTIGVYSQAELKKKRKPEPRYLYQVTLREKQAERKTFGFIDQTGKQIIEFDRLPDTTVAVGDFHEGRARIYLNDKDRGEYRQRHNDRVGFIDETGKVIIDARFATARDFSEGLAYVEAKDFKGFIDRFGKAVIKTAYPLTKDFHEGLAAVLVNDTNRRDAWGYIDRTGKLAIKQAYSFADDFSEGLAGVEVDYKYGFINQKGEMVIPPRFGVRKEYPYTHGTLSSGRFVEGLACVRDGKLYGYIDRNGKFVLQPQFSRAQEFSEGLAWVTTRDDGGGIDRIGWIDKAGRWIVTSVGGRKLSRDLREFFDYANPNPDWRYFNGLVSFHFYSEHRVFRGYMDRQGRTVIKPIDLEAAHPFVGDLAWIRFPGHSPWQENYGYINKAGVIVWRSRK